MGTKTGGTKGLLVLKKMVGHLGSDGILAGARCTGEGHGG